VLGRGQTNPRAKMKVTSLQPVLAVTSLLATAPAAPVNEPREPREPKGFVVAEPRPLSATVVFDRYFLLSKCYLKLLRCLRRLRLLRPSLLQLQLLFLMLQLHLMRRPNRCLSHRVLRSNHRVLKSDHQDRQSGRRDHQSFHRSGREDRR
jgi:hypothetical protein